MLVIFKIYYKNRPQHSILGRIEAANWKTVELIVAVRRIDPNVTEVQAVGIDTRVLKATPPVAVQTLAVYSSKIAGVAGK